MSERMEIEESIYEGVVEPPYKNTRWTYTNRDGCSRNNRGESALSKTHPMMGEISRKRIKRYVDGLTSKLQTFLINSPGHSSEECKALRDFVAD